MGMQNRVITCDVCDKKEEEKNFGSGWPGWSITSGIGAKEPVPGMPLQKKNTETCLCPKHSSALADYITEMQNWHSNNAFIDKV